MKQIVLILMFFVSIGATCPNNSIIIEKHFDQTNLFLYKIAEKESSNNHLAYNKYGYMGKYQFGKVALMDIGINFINIKNFKKVWTEKQQDSAMMKLLKLNKKRLQREIKKYVGKEMNGIIITESGLLAASHIAGAEGVKRFLKTSGKYNPKDKLGTKLTDYLKLFSNYNIKI
ncbi:hypothetical protein GMMP1_510007 [Candidatus Magnetomoraceae bacterium gMMP-1]